MWRDKIKRTAEGNKRAFKEIFQKRMYVSVEIRERRKNKYKAWRWTVNELVDEMKVD